MNIERIIKRPLEENCYIVYTKAGGGAYIIDPGYDLDRTIDFVNGHELKVKAILLTHTHRDHSNKAHALAKYFGVDVCAHREEFDHPNHYRGGECRYLEDGENLGFGSVFIDSGDDEIIKILHTPGHTAGGLCFYIEKSKVAFTGDTIFNVDLGYTHFAGGSVERMKDSLKNVVNKWSNDVTIYPGHGGPATMKYVRRVNKEFLDMVAD